MREIKFRVWDKRANRMYSVNNIHFPSGNISVVERAGSDILGADYGVILKLGDEDSVALMQYTGLKDKNGKEIYEGDILKHHDRNFVVKWDEFMAAFQAENVKDKVDADFFNWGNVPSLVTSGIPGHFRHDMLDANCEVIGNIYENPELLK